MPANPILDEQALLQLLHDVRTPKTPDQIRWMSNMVLLAAHGRNVKREFFVEVINTTSEVHTLLGELQSAGRMHHLMAQLDPARENITLNEQTDKLVRELLAARKTLTGLMEKVSQCPTLDDPIS